MKLLNSRDCVSTLMVMGKHLWWVVYLQKIMEKLLGTHGVP